MSRRRIGGWYRLAVIVLKPALLLTTKRNWRGAENLPATGGVITVTNHISYVDPFTFGHFVYERGRLPRFLAKESVFRLPLLGRLVRGAGQIPVYRDTNDAGAAYSAAVTAVRAGECVSFYPEGTLTRDPGQWPMRGRSGAVRVALETGAPLVPIAQWGAQEILPAYSKRFHLVPRQTVWVSAGPPVDLSRFAGQPVTVAVLEEATGQMMNELTALLEEIRGETAPAQRYDPRTSGNTWYGNPNPKQPKQQKRKRSGR
ncbi:lysophospholipid acyltransferase family protein [Kineosporia sp. NBRC 101731]|uniref:lysophospholipid acyltransferase family protein n=1 Tax=Kineosporia sp. NBRC 101731 TaxID=3032199 RepID=UPI0024A3F7D1|nr:lysophospholipid acyltransferase family protein [Kineosporia sp. NBRC 101731]GLY30125.1 1-acyl-sn-glycerol-3-phosphate acyltransferase [Kineosporia sp. NBRC 101731]